MWPAHLGRDRGHLLLHLLGTTIVEPGVMRLGISPIRQSKGVLKVPSVRKVFHQEAGVREISAGSERVQQSARLVAVVNVKVHVHASAAENIEPKFNRQHVVRAEVNRATAPVIISPKLFTLPYALTSSFQEDGPCTTNNGFNKLPWRLSRIRSERTRRLWILTLNLVLLGLP